MKDRYPRKNVRHKYILLSLQETGSVANKNRNESFLLNVARQIENLRQYAMFPRM